jgi:gamma-glutamyltranspeptidase
LSKLDLEQDILRNTMLKQIFTNSNNELVKEGDTIKNIDLAASLELLARKESIFYHETGDLGRELIEELTQNVQKKNLKQISQL